MYYKNGIYFFEHLQSKIFPSSSKVTSNCGIQLLALFHTQGNFSNPLEILYYYSLQNQSLFFTLYI